MGRLVNLSEILDGDGFSPRDVDFLQVNTIWTSGFIKTKEGKKICKYIFSDVEGRHIGGYLFWYDEANANNIHRILQQPSCWFQLTKFKVERIENESWCDVRRQHWQIKISQSSLNVQKCESENHMWKHLPFDFMSLDKIDECQIDTTIDVIGFATDLTKKLKSKDELTEYKNLTIASTATKTDSNKVMRKIAIFENCFKQVTAKHHVYAMLNIKVKEFGPDGEKNKSLQTTGKTIIWKIHENELEKLPPAYQTDPSISALFPKKRTKSETSSGSTRPKPHTNSTPTATQILQEALDAEYSPEHPGYYTSDYSAPIASTSSGVTADRKRQNNAEESQQYAQKRHRQTSETFDNNDNDYYRRSARLYTQATTETVEGGSSSSQLSRRESTASSNFSDIMGPPKKRLADFPKKSYDFYHSKEPLKVVVKNSEEYMDIGLDTYRMRSSPRGRVLIINNYYFDERGKRGRKPFRHGTLHDLKILNDLFNGLGFEVDWCHDLTSGDIQNTLDKFKRSFTENMDACVVVVLSHGVLGYVEMVDGKYVSYPNDIVHQFDEVSFPIMAGKPKLFLAQLCQELSKAEMYKQVVETKNERTDLELLNIIEMFATIPGTQAERDVHLGSPFVYVFVDTVMEHAHDTDLLTLLPVVQSRLKNVKRKKSNKLHCSWQPHGFDKTFYFNPGLHE